MAETRPLGTSSPVVDIRRVVKSNHEEILALFQVYLRSPADSRQAIVEQILHRLVLHLEMVENLIFQEIWKLGPQGRTLVGDAELGHEEIKSMILTRQQTEGDEDQALDEFFGDMMQTVRASFTAEERDLLPLLDRSLDS